MTWIDTPWPQDPARLKAGGYDIMRYLCSDWNTGPGTSMPNKRISRPELDSYIAAGVDVAVNFEDAADDYLGGYTRGKEKGQKAGTWMATELGWPSGGVCCSSIDADIGTTWGGLAQTYQMGFSDGLKSAGPYLPGIYGSSIALNGANHDGTAVVFWLTAALSWSHGVEPDVLHMWQNGYWPYGSDADLNVTVLEPMGSYLHPLGEVADMTPEEHDALMRIDQRQANVFLDKTSGHPYSLPNILARVDTLEPSVAGLKKQLEDIAAAVALPGEVVLTGDQVAAIAAVLAASAPPNYTGTVDIRPAPPVAPTP